MKREGNKGRRELSLPTRGGWIEIIIANTAQMVVPSLPTRGGWIEMSGGEIHPVSIRSPSPHGEGGLKYHVMAEKGEIGRVPPHTGRVD